MEETVTVTTVLSANDRARHVMFIRTPALWPAWPFLPLIRRTGATQELGLLFDVWSIAGLTGFSSSVFLCNVFLLPPTIEALLASPRETFDTTDELLDAHWRID
jgi:hypothetical protein